jgi:hypothetical protein
MDPFNIVIRNGQQQIDLNIHPQETGSYMIIYHGALLGKIFLGSDGENWKALTVDKIQPAGMPSYDYDETSGYRYILMNTATVQQIGRQIVQSQNL